MYVIETRRREGINVRWINHRTVLLSGLALSSSSFQGLVVCKLIMLALGWNEREFMRTTVGSIAIWMFSAGLLLGLFIFPIIALFMQRRDGLPVSGPVLPLFADRLLRIALILIIGFMLWLFAAALYIGMQ